MASIARRGQAAARIIWFGLLVIVTMAWATMASAQLVNGDFEDKAPGPNSPNPFNGLPTGDCVNGTGAANYAPNPWGTQSTPDYSVENFVSFNTNVDARSTLPNFDASPNGGCFMGFRSFSSTANEGLWQNVTFADVNAEYVFRYEYTEYTEPGFARCTPQVEFRVNGNDDSNGTSISFAPNVGSANGPSVEGEWVSLITSSFIPANFGLTPTSNSFDIYLGVVANGCARTWAFVDGIEIILEPPVATDDASLNNPVRLETTLDIANNDSADAEQDRVSLIPPAGATNIVTDARGDVISFEVPGQGVWSYDDASGDVTFTRDPALNGNPDPIQYTTEALNGAVSEPAEIEITFIANPFVTDVTNAGACVAAGGVLSGVNVYSDFDNGTFGTGSGPQSSPATNPYGTAINGTYAQYVGRPTNNAFSTPGYGEYAFVSNIEIARNRFQHEGGIEDPTDPNGRFFHTDPNNSIPPSFTQTFTGLLPGESYEIDFWVADAEISLTSPKNRVEIFVDGASIYDTGFITNVTTNQLVWYRHATVATADSSGTMTVELRTTEAGQSGRDIHIDNISMQLCNIVIADDDSSTGNVPGTDVTVSVVGNDTSSGSPLDPTTVSMVVPSGATGVITDANGDVIGFTVPGEGNWSVDPATGDITFAPDLGFAGDPTPIDYTVSNTNGQESNPATVTIGYTVVSPGGLPPFQCESAFYEVISGQLALLNISTGAYDPVGPQQTTYNGTGYNILDNYVYAFQSNNLIRVGSDGNIETVANVGDSSSNAAMDFSGNIYFDST